MSLVLWGDMVNLVLAGFGDGLRGLQTGALVAAPGTADGGK
jgi:hypothetical protein